MRGRTCIEYAYLAAFVGVAGYVALNGIVPAVATTYNQLDRPNRPGAPSLWEPADLLDQFRFVRYSIMTLFDFREIVVLVVALVGGGLRRAHAAHPELADVWRGAIAALAYARVRCGPAGCRYRCRRVARRRCAVLPVFCARRYGRWRREAAGRARRVARARRIGLARDLSRRSPAACLACSLRWRAGTCGRLSRISGLMLMHWRTQGLGPVPGLTLKDTSSPRLAYAIPITIGVLCTLWRR